MTKYIFVTGGVVSSVGKGVTSASIGRLLVERGLKVSVLKFDPYLNLNLGALNPVQHGEIFVTSDGAEVDWGMGHYERFLDINVTSNSYYTAGMIYASLLDKEKEGKFLGSTIQVVPHLTAEIKSTIKAIGGQDIDVAIIEIGGTTGDIENQVFVEAIRQFERELKGGNYVHIHCALVPYLQNSKETKTKPAQQSAYQLMSMGIYPDFVVCRTDSNIELGDFNKKKIAMLCNLDDSSCVIHNPDCETVYEVPLVFKKQGFDRTICSKLGINSPDAGMEDWHQMVDTIESDLPSVNIAIVSKYTQVSDSYISIAEAIKHAAIKNKYSAKIDIVSSEDIEVFGAKEVLKNYNGVVVTQGFGTSGLEGKITTAQYCREHKVPYLGIGLGMHVAIIDFARNVAHLTDANSTEFNPLTPHAVVMQPEKSTNLFESDKSSVRLGSYKCTLGDSTLAKKLYASSEGIERHRHQFEFNNQYKENFEKLGMVFSGVNKDTNLADIIEYKDHPYFIATAFNPEFKSRPYRAHPLFVGLITQAIFNIKKS